MTRFLNGLNKDITNIVELQQAGMCFDCHVINNITSSEIDEKKVKAF